MRIGIFLGYGPQDRLTREGLGRFLAQRIIGFLKGKHSITIACPAWTYADLKSLFKDFNINEDKICFIVEERIPFLWRIYKINSLKNKKFFCCENLYNKFGAGAEKLLIVLMSCTNGISFLSIIFLYVLLAILTIPLLVLALLINFCGKIFHKLTGKGKKVSLNLFEWASRKFRIYSPSQLSFDMFLLEQLTSQTNRRLVEKINKSKKQDIWYSTTIFWPEFNKIEGIKVMNMPDYVVRDFAIQFSQSDYVCRLCDRYAQTVDEGSYFITYSQYIKDATLIDFFGKSERSIRTIPHGINNMSAYITFAREELERFHVDVDFSASYARQILQSATPCVQNILSIGQYIGRFWMDDVHYIFYASQTRPHKNILTLLKAYRYLLCECDIQVKLFLTGYIESGEISEYISENHLELDVISFFNVSSKQLAALYKCADLAINPTLYEGGFPFTFGEAMSVGTPVIMSDIPQVREVVYPFRLEQDMLFDPYDWKEMADKIQYALQNRDALYHKELPLYRELEKRTDNIVAEEYIHAFEYFIEQDKTAEDN